MTLPNRLAIVLLTLAFLTGLTTQRTIAASMETAGQAIVMAIDMSGHDTDGQNPCKGSKPSCADYSGCVLITGLPMTPGSAPVPVTWNEIQYGEIAVSLVGLSIAPELSPPILAV